jgi:hypothetical protein
MRTQAHRFEQGLRELPWRRRDAGALIFGERREIAIRCNPITDRVISMLLIGGALSDVRINGIPAESINIVLVIGIGHAIASGLHGQR